MLRQVARQSQQQAVDWEDPVKFVLRTWPWREEVETLSDTLQAVNPQTGSGSEEDPLVMSLVSTILIIMIIVSDEYADELTASYSRQRYLQ